MKRPPGGVWWNDTESQFDVEGRLRDCFVRDYPGVDVDAEIRKAGQWHAAKREWTDFRMAIVRWLNRAAAGGNGKGATRPATLDELAEAASRNPTAEDLAVAFAPGGAA